MKPKQKIRVLKFIFFFAVCLSFAVGAPESWAEGKLIGRVEESAENKIKVCRDVTCAKPTPFIIDFEKVGDPPFSIDKENGLTGKVWGNELGWITFNPPYGGVFFADAETGLLKGTAWSERSGAINFSVTGQKVVIDPKTGEWNGWAWASGPYGGWIKFDCQQDSCVKIIWSEAPVEKISPEISFSENSEESLGIFAWLIHIIKDTAVSKSRIFFDNLKIFVSRIDELFYRTKLVSKEIQFSISEMAQNGYNSLSVCLLKSREKIWNTIGETNNLFSSSLSDFRAMFLSRIIIFN